MQLEYKFINMRYLYILLLTLIVNACSGQRSQKTELPRSFEMAQVPTLLSDPGERADYLAKHYWDKFDFHDTTYIHEPEITEQALSNYIDLLSHVTPETRSSSIKTMMARAEQDSTMFHYFSEMTEKYLYDPLSPQRNEEIYIAVLEYIIQTSSLNEVEKIRPAHLLEQAQRNRIETPATDFTYTLADGRDGQLYGIQADYLLLFFHNPDCQACLEITRQLSASPLVNDLLNNKTLSILAIYPDEDLEAWKAHIPTMPKEWINAYDQGHTLKNDEIYDLKAIPTLYILDKGKKVLQKDISFQQTEAFLSTIAPG